MENNRGQLTLTADEFRAAVNAHGGRRLVVDDTPTIENMGGVCPRPRDQRERRFQDELVYLAQLEGWAAYHVYDSRHTIPGFPDLELTRSSPIPRIIKAELKDDTNKPTAEQIDWLNLYARVGPPVEAYLWRPCMFDAIREVLKAKWICDADPRMFGLWALRHEPVTVRGVPTQARRKRRP